MGIWYLSQSGRSIWNRRNILLKRGLGNSVGGLLNQFHIQVNELKWHHRFVVITAVTCLFLFLMPNSSNNPSSSMVITKSVPLASATSSNGNTIHDDTIIDHGDWNHQHHHGHGFHPSNNNNNRNLINEADEEHNEEDQEDETNDHEENEQQDSFHTDDHHHHSNNPQSTPIVHSNNNNNINPHIILSHHISILAQHVENGKTFTIVGVPHFAGGRDLIRKDFQQRNMTELDFADSAGGADIFSISCNDLRNRNVNFARRRANSVVVTGAQDERSLLVKRGFYWSIKRASASHGASCYMRVIPETFMTEKWSECMSLLSRLQSDLAANINTMWFLKTKMESFGRGVDTMTSINLIKRLNDCKPQNDSINFLVQRGIPNVIKIGNKVTQGRVYVVIPRFFPLTVFFFDGYVNVALFPNSTITNSVSNRTPRLLPRDLFHALNLSPKQLATVRNNVKIAILRAILALKPRLLEVETSSSFAIWGLDLIYYRSGASSSSFNNDNIMVSILEINCNAELFAREDKSGLVRARVSRNLVHKTHDLILAAHFARNKFDSILTEVVNQHYNLLQDPMKSLELDFNGLVLNYTKPLELIYSETQPRFSLLESDEFCAGK
jgi:hypothetical protein